MKNITNVLKNVNGFIDELGTKFIKGPHDYLGTIEDWKFRTAEGDEDYCSEKQIIDWCVTIVKELK